jgi:acyl transferase domain-containing protein
MLACSKLYRKSLEELDTVPARVKDENPKWFSSVSPGVQLTSVNAEYWARNMCRPVMFKDALTAAINRTGTPDLES